MPAIAEADDDFLYVLKFRGAGQGVKALIAELIGGEIARALGFKVPEIVFANLDEALDERSLTKKFRIYLNSASDLTLLCTISRGQ